MTIVLEAENSGISESVDWDKTILVVIFVRSDDLRPALPARRPPTLLAFEIFFLKSRTEKP